MTSSKNHSREPSRKAVVAKFSGDGDDFRWDDVDILVYKPTGTHFRDISRQILFGAEHGLSSQLRYFEIAEDGHSTLERHVHVHAVMILRGKGQVLLGDSVQDVNAFDTVYIPPMTWHQFRANRKSALGFLCLVACDRDKPIRPDEGDLAELRQIPAVESFIRV